MGRVHNFRILFYRRFEVEYVTIYLQNFTMCINLELKSGSFSFVFKTWLFSDIYYCWHQVRCERETYETRGTDWVSCPVSQSIHHLWLCFSRIVFCICVCLSNIPPSPTLFCFVLVPACLSIIHQYLS